MTLNIALAIIVIGLFIFAWWWQANDIKIGIVDDGEPRDAGQNPFCGDAASIYDAHQCPDCTGTEFDTYEDGGGHGYEVRFTCKNPACGAVIGLNPTLRHAEFVRRGLGSRGMK